MDEHDQAALRAAMLDAVREIAHLFEVTYISNAQSASAQRAKQNLYDARQAALIGGCSMNDVHEATMDGYAIYHDRRKRGRKQSRGAVNLAKIPGGSTISVDEAKRLGILDDLIGARRTGGGE